MKKLLPFISYIHVAPPIFCLLSWWWAGMLSRPEGWSILPFLFIWVLAGASAGASGHQLSVSLEQTRHAIAQRNAIRAQRDTALRALHHHGLLTGYTHKGFDGTLLPCPFCGHDEPTLEDLDPSGGPGPYEVQCGECQAYVWGEYVEEVTLTWNTRWYPHALP